MFLNRKKGLDKPTEDRQKVINYKKYFGTAEGREVMTDLMNRFHVLNPFPPGRGEHEDAKAEGQRSVVLYMLAEANVDLARLEDILKGNYYTEEKKGS